MACARPVVATRGGGIPEVVVDGETGFLVPPRDPEALALAIVRLVMDRGLREKMGAAGLARVQAAFSAEHMVKNTLRVYRRVAQRQVPGSPEAEDSRPAT
jgi:glycosyltransferase involved in cell wall biosynthesis